MECLPLIPLGATGGVRKSPTRTGKLTSFYLTAYFSGSFWTNSLTITMSTTPEILIPSLPNDIFLQCLACVPRQYHPVLAAVAKPIRSLVSSRNSSPRDPPSTAQNSCFTSGSDAQNASPCVGSRSIEDPTQRTTTKALLNLLQSQQFPRTC
ncbi:hypothetical protein L484_009830 [Morus notabilis]|uniref:F-box domain-containing protein n=1 Tax=Morus notabilis TaxID=981085 RepID=W9SCK5_9ROSA|nr:hypothetical protein L484_009830 [Morus notabilis]